MAQLHVTVSAATHLYVTSHFIPRRDQMTQLGVCLSDMMRGLDWLGWWSRLHMAEQQARGTPLRSSVSTLLNLFLLFPVFSQPVASVSLQIPWKFCSIKKSQKCESDANPNFNFVAEPQSLLSYN